MEETISLQEIAKIIRKRLLLIIILTVISIAITAGVSFYVLTPIYQAQTQILVNQNNNTEEVNSWEKTNQMDLRLIKTYNGIITSPVILNPVIEKLELDGLDVIIKYVNDDKADNGVVTAQSLKAKTKVDEYSEITIKINKKEEKDELDKEKVKNIIQKAKSYGSEGC